MLQRHSLVWLSARGWESVRDGAAPETVPVRDALARWQSAGWPLVVRRSESGLPPGRVAVGLPLPPDAVTATKLRIAAIVDHEDVLRCEPPLALASILQHVPLHWRGALAALQMEWIGSLPPLQVFGSLAWQTITGMPYLRPVSDIDLLFRPVTRHQLAYGVTLLAASARALPLDGEILFPSGAAVAWKEWHDVAGIQRGVPAGMVLAKHASGVSLVSCKALLATFEGAACIP